MDINKIIQIIRDLKEEAPTMNLGAGKIAGTPEADPGNPPVNRKKRKRKKYASLGHGSRKRWMV